MTLLQNLVLMLCCFCLEFCTATDTITSIRPINDPESIVSNGSTFKLGFFSPFNSTNRYVGIWYNNLSATAVVWLPNRGKPLHDSSGTVTISEDGNLVVMDGQKQIVWSSNVPNSSSNSNAQLLDSGNLVLQDNFTGSKIWESFEHPSDSFLQEMKISTNKYTAERTLLTSWKSSSDPSTGSFTYGMNPLNIPELYVWNGSHPYWRSGPWNKQIFIGMPNMVVYYDTLDVVDDKEGTVYITYTSTMASVLYYFLNSDGVIVQRYLMLERIIGKIIRLAPLNGCEIYGKCGPFGSCNMQDSPTCTCLQVFDPKDLEEWSRGNWTTGCVRRRHLQCERNITTGEKSKEDGFLKLQRVCHGHIHWSNFLYSFLQILWIKPL